MSAPSRRTLIVRLGQLVLLAGWAWLLFRVVYSPLVNLHAPGQPVPLPGGVRFPTHPPLRGDPLPWAVEPMAGGPDDYRYRPDGRPGGWWLDPNPNRPGRWDWRTWRFVDPFAPAVGLLLALAVPPLLFDRLTGRRRWNRWRLVAVAAAAGGLALGVGRAVVYPAADRGTIGYLAGRLYDQEPVPFARDTILRLRADGWGPLLPPATLFGLTVGGLTAAGALRPWRPARTAQPEPPGEQPFTGTGPPL